MKSSPKAGRPGVSAGRRLSRTGVAPAVLALLLLSAGLRLYRLESQSVWDNEAFSMVTSRLSMHEMTTRLLKDFIHPPLYQYALHWWFGIFGFGVFQARMLFVVFDVAAVGMMYWLGSLTFGGRTGLIVALLLAVSQLCVEYSQESRSYAMAMCVGIFTTILFWLALRRRTKVFWLAFVLSAALLTYLHYAAGLSVACLYALLSRVPASGTLAPEAPRRTQRPIPIKWLLSGAFLIIVLFIPWFSMGVFQVAAKSPKVSLVREICGYRRASASRLHEKSPELLAGRVKRSLLPEATASSHTSAANALAICARPARLVPHMPLRWSSATPPSRKLVGETPQCRLAHSNACIGIEDVLYRQGRNGFDLGHHGVEVPLVLVMHEDDPLAGDINRDVAAIALDLIEIV